MGRRSRKRKPVNSSVSDNTSDNNSDVSMLKSVDKTSRKQSKFRKEDREKSSDSTIVDVSDVNSECGTETTMATGGRQQEGVGEQEETGEVSNKDLMTQLKQMTVSINEMRLSQERLSSDMFELKQENDTLKKDIAECKKREDELKREVSEAKYLAKTAHKYYCDLEQYGRRNNVRVFGIPESGQETIAQCESKVIRILNNKMGLRHLNSEHIEVAHRVGKRPKTSSDPPRPVIVRFLSRKTVSEVFQNKRKLLNTDYMVVEDLTKENYNLLVSCKDHDNCETTWSLRGKIYARLKNGETMQVSAVSDLDNMNFDQRADTTDFVSSTPVHGVRGRGLGYTRGAGTQRQYSHGARGGGAGSQRGAPLRGPFGGRPYDRRAFGGNGSGDRAFGERAYGGRAFGERAFAERAYGGRAFGDGAFGEGASGGSTGRNRSDPSSRVRLGFRPRARSAGETGDDDVFGLNTRL